MKTINLRPKDHSDIRLSIGAWGAKPDATYYLRVFSDGTFDIYGRLRSGEMIGLGSVGMDGIGAGTALESRLARFLEDNKEIVL